MSTALVAMELERGVVGDLSTIDGLADAARARGTLEACGRLAVAAREAGLPVVHCIAEWRGDRRGTPANTPLTRRLVVDPAQILERSPSVELVPQLGDTAGDLRSVRRHGLAPFHGTDLDPLLRSLDVAHLVVCGVSLNVGIPGLVLGAVDRGYEVTVATDAVVGVPPEYGDAVLVHTLAALAEMASSEEIVSSWS